MRIIATVLTILTILAFFTYQSPAQETIRIGLMITTEANERFDNIVFGTDQRATLGLDTELGERDYPGWPWNSLHAFVVVVDPQTNEEYYSYKNFKPFPEDTNKFYAEYGLTVNPYIGENITVTWGILPAAIDSAYFTKPYPTGDLFSINMKENKSYTYNYMDYGKPTKTLFKVWFSRDINNIDEATGANGTISLYPNPAADVLTLRNIRDKSRYTIYNILGEVAKQGLLGQKISQINIQNFQAGYYYIKIADNYGNQLNRSFLKK